MTFGKRQPPGYRGINRRSALTREPVDMPAEILVPGLALLNAGSLISLTPALGFPLNQF